MGKSNPRDRAPVSVTKIRQLTGSLTLEGGTDSGVITLGIPKLPTGFFSGRVTVAWTTVSVGSDLSVGWGFESSPRSLPVYVDKAEADFVANDFAAFDSLAVGDLTTAVAHTMWLTNPDDPKALMLIPHGENLILTLDWIGTAADEVTVSVEVDYESWTDRAPEVA